MGSGDCPRVGNFRRHPERIFQWAENRSVPAENNMSERGVRRTVIARKVCVRCTRASASLTCSSRCRHTRQNSVGDGRGPVAFTKAGRSRICLSDNGKILKADCGFGLDDSKSSDALLLRYSVAEVGHDRAVLTNRVPTPLRVLADSALAAQQKRGQVRPLPQHVSPSRPSASPRSCAFRTRTRCRFSSRPSPRSHISRRSSSRRFARGPLRRDGRA